MSRSLEEFRYPIALAIAESACTWLDDIDAALFTPDLGIAIAQFMGYNTLINYKWNYPPNGKLFDTRDAVCAPYGFLAGQRVQTPEGVATVIGVAPLPPNYDYAQQQVSNAATPNELFFDLDADESGLNRRKCWPTYREQQFEQHGFVALYNGSRVNIWAQSFHSFAGKQWWNDTQYLTDAKLTYFDKFGDDSDPRYQSIKYKRLNQAKSTPQDEEPPHAVTGLDEEELV